MYEQEEILEQEIEEISQFDKREKLQKRTIYTTVAILITISTIFIPKYRDFDVIFKAIYNLRFEDYVLSENLGSFAFIIAFLISVIITILIWIVLLRNDDLTYHPRIKKYYEIFDIASIIPIFMAIITFSNALVLSPASVTRTSMEPNYYEGDDVFVYHTSNYERYDVVIVMASEGEQIPGTNLYEKNQYYIKRIIGLPGETITLKDGDIYINGELLDDPTVLKTGAGTYCSLTSEAENQECTFTIPEGEYFLIGDNREASFDSRALGSFEEEDLYGKVVFKIG